MVLVNAHKVGRIDNAKPATENRKLIIDPTKPTKDLMAMKTLMNNKADSDAFFGANLATKKGRLDFLRIYGEYFTHNNNKLKWVEREDTSSEPWKDYFNFKKKFDAVNTLFLSAVEGNHRFIVIVYNLLFRKAHETTTLSLDSDPEEEELLTEEYIKGKDEDTNNSSMKLKTEGETSLAERYWLDMAADSSRLLSTTLYLPVKEFGDDYTIEEYTETWVERGVLITRAKKTGSGRNVLHAVLRLCVNLRPCGGDEPESSELENAVFVIDEAGIEQKIEGGDAIRSALTNPKNEIYNILNSNSPSQVRVSDIEKVIYMKDNDGNKYSVNTKRSEQVATYVKGKRVTLFDLCSAISYYLILRVLQKEEAQYRNKNEAFPDSIADAVLEKNLYSIFLITPGTEDNRKKKKKSEQLAIQPCYGDDRNERFDIGTFIFLLFTVAVFKDKMSALIDLLEKTANENNDASENRAILRRLYVTMILISKNQYKSLIEPLLKAGETPVAVAHKKTLVVLANTFELLTITGIFGFNPTVRDDLVVSDCTNLESLQKFLEDKGDRNKKYIDIIEEIKEKSSEHVIAYLKKLGKQVKQWLVDPSAGKDTTLGINVLTITYFIYWIDSVARVTLLNEPQTREQMKRLGVWHFGQKSFTSTKKKKDQARATLKWFEGDPDNANNMKTAIGLNVFVPLSNDTFCTVGTKLQLVCEPAEPGSIYDEAPEEGEGRINFRSTDQETNENNGGDDSDNDEDGDDEDEAATQGGGKVKAKKRKKDGTDSGKSKKKRKKATPKSVTPNKKRVSDDATVQTIVTRSINDKTEEGKAAKSVLHSMMGVNRETLKKMKTKKLVGLITRWQEELIQATKGDDNDDEESDDKSESSESSESVDGVSGDEMVPLGVNGENYNHQNEADAIIDHIDQLLQLENYEVDGSCELMTAYAMIVKLTDGGKDAVQKKCQEKGYDLEGKESECLMEWTPDITGKNIVVYSCDSGDGQEVQQSRHGSEDGEQQYCFKYVNEDDEEYWVLLRERTDN